MKIINLPAADRKFARVVRRYHKDRPGKAEAFINEIDRVATLIADNPYLGRPVGDALRGYVLDRFPYTIYYEIRAGLIIVAAVTHHRRRPGYWRNRLDTGSGS